MKHAPDQNFLVHLCNLQKPRFDRLALSPLSLEDSEHKPHLVLVVIVAAESILQSEDLLGFQEAEPGVEAFLLLLHVFLEVMADHPFPCLLLAVLVGQPVIEHLGSKFAFVPRRHKLFWLILFNDLCSVNIVWGRFA